MGFLQVKRGVLLSGPVVFIREKASTGIFFWGIWLEYIFGVVFLGVGGGLLSSIEGFRLT